MNSEVDAGLLAAAQQQFPLTERSEPAQGKTVRISSSRAPCFAMNLGILFVHRCMLLGKFEPDNGSIHRAGTSDYPFLNRAQVRLRVHRFVNWRLRFSFVEKASLSSWTFSCPFFPNVASCHELLAKSNQEMQAWQYCRKHIFLHRTL